ncbi:MAG TPA: hypothetical protein VFZ25_15950, partial [Chloroflexota bacterium]|nr:hypothetical protein [Chloroflexota bacterium]
DGYANILSGEVRQLVFTGDMVRLEVQIAGQTLHAHATGRRRFEFLDHSPNTVFLGVGEPAMVRDDSTM